jgi:hypothetical protein
LVSSQKNHLYSQRKLEAQDSLLMDHNDDQEEKAAQDAYIKSMQHRGESSLPKIKHKKKVKRNKQPSPKPDWDHRFYVDSLGNYTNKHNHYKVIRDSEIIVNTIALFR